MSIQLVEVQIPFAGIEAIEVEVVYGLLPGTGINWITSLTAPSDTNSGWIDPSTGMYAIYIGGGWVTTSSGAGIPDGALTFGGDVLTFGGETLTFTP